MAGAIIKLIVSVLPRALWTVVRLGTALLGGVGSRRRAVRAFEGALMEHGISPEAAAELSQDFPRLDLGSFKKVLPGPLGSRGRVKEAG